MPLQTGQESLDEMSLARCQKRFSVQNTKLGSFLFSGTDTANLDVTAFLCSLHQLMKLAFPLSPASAWSFLLSLLKCASAQKGARLKALLDLFCRAALLANRLCSVLLCQRALHNTQTAFRENKPQTQLLVHLKRGSLLSIMLPTPLFSSSVLKEVSAAWNLSVQNWGPAQPGQTEPGSGVTLSSALMVAAVMASGDKGNGDLQSTLWQETSCCLTQGCTAFCARKSFSKEHML